MGAWLPVSNDDSKLQRHGRAREVSSRRGGESQLGVAAAGERLPPHATTDRWDRCHRASSGQLAYRW
ncbi:hypothetical protein GUJ93_ZPchr0013g35657 [Zizania palustris]|uniref:Uncharacterized protein n=1 Tax=Zizania palustris TaxID=103762 RepID=A0A8J5WU75_ZIZPA|nr:hypothetical protein GUJ93_ZPchr0013g35657 [Zizania palustris]